MNHVDDKLGNGLTQKLTNGLTNPGQSAPEFALAAAMITMALTLTLTFSLAAFGQSTLPAVGQTSAPLAAANVNTDRADLTIQNFLGRELEMAKSNNQGQAGYRFEVTVGQIDSRLQLAPCARIEPHLPANARLWGRVNVMLRCVEGANWNVSLPVTVRVFGMALTANRQILANEAVRESDVDSHEVELSRDPGVPVTSFQQLEQKTLARPVAAGTVLRQDWLRALPVIVAGDMVKVIAKGSGFSVTSDGQALNQATDGQTVRIKTESGRVISGTARIGRIAEIRL